MAGPIRDGLHRIIPLVRSVVQKSDNLPLSSIKSMGRSFSSAEEGVSLRSRRVAEVFDEKKTDFEANNTVARIPKRGALKTHTMTMGAQTEGTGVLQGVAREGFFGRYGGMQSMPAGLRREPQRRVFTTITGAEAEKYADRLQEASQDLPAVKALKTAVNDHQFAVVYGGPSTGKTEQIEIAFGRNQQTFDLRQEFFNDTRRKENLADTDENWDRVTTDKDKQLSWLKENYDEIKAKLRESPAKTIVLDEIDLSNSSEMSPPELEAVKLMMTMADELKKEGKNVIVILHEVGIGTPEVSQQLVESGLLQERSQVVQTGFLPLEVVKKFNEACFLNPIESKSIEGFALGSPLGFNHLLVQSAKFSKGDRPKSLQVPEYNDILKEGVTKTEKIWNVQKKIAAPKTLELLRQIVNKEKGIDDPEVLEHREELLATSLVGCTDDGTLIVPELTYDIISREAENENLRKFGELLVLKDEEAIKTALKDHPEFNEIAKFSLLTTGSVRILKRDGDLFVIPGYNIATSQSWTTQRQIINSALDKVNRLVPHEANTPACADFRNSAATVEELHEDAHGAKYHFSQHLEQVAAMTGATLNAGPGNKFMVKSIESLNAKIKRWKEDSGLSEERVVKQINDGLRATLICKDVKEMERTIEVFYQLSEKSEVISGQAYSNKFDQNYASGYVGYHCNGVLRFDGKDVRFEVQFHLESVADGTSTSPKELSHKIYENARGDNGESKIPIQLNFTGQLCFAAGMSSALPVPTRVVEH